MRRMLSGSGIGLFVKNRETAKERKREKRQGRSIMAAAEKDSSCRHFVFFVFSLFRVFAILNEPTKEQPHRGRSPSLVLWMKDPRGSRGSIW